MTGFLGRFADRYLKHWCEILAVEATILVVLWLSAWLFAAITK